LVSSQSQHLDSRPLSVLGIVYIGSLAEVFGHWALGIFAIQGAVYGQGWEICSSSEANTIQMSRKYKYTDLPPSFFTELPLPPETGRTRATDFSKNWRVT